MVQKKSYIDAVICLTKKNATSGIANALNRFDDHEAVHSSQTPAIHWVGHFILWHRYFTATYEKALRDDCGYTGGQPYVSKTFYDSDQIVSNLLTVTGTGRRTRILRTQILPKSSKPRYSTPRRVLVGTVTMSHLLQRRIH